MKNAPPPPPRPVGLGGFRSGAAARNLVRARSVEIAQAVADDPDAAPVLDEAFWPNASLSPGGRQGPWVTRRRARAKTNVRIRRLSLGNHIQSARELARGL